MAGVSARGKGVAQKRATSAATTRCGSSARIASPITATPDAPAPMASGSVFSSMPPRARTGNAASRAQRRETLDAERAVGGLAGADEDRA